MLERDQTALQGQLMILYEVNLSVEAAILNDFEKWLDAHIRQILKIDGFIGAEWWRDTANHGGNTSFIVQYRIADEEKMDFYLKLHAPKLRDDAVKQFENHFSATRRILKGIKSY